jgi:hypothetical protein
MFSSKARIETAIKYKNAVHGDDSARKHRRLDVRVPRNHDLNDAAIERAKNARIALMKLKKRFTAANAAAPSSHPTPFSAPIGYK